MALELSVIQAEKAQCDWAQASGEKRTPVPHSDGTEIHALGKTAEALWEWRGRPRHSAAADVALSTPLQQASWTWELKLSPEESKE